MPEDSKIITPDFTKTPESEIAEDAVKGNAEEQLMELRNAVEASVDDDSELKDQIDENGMFTCHACGFHSKGEDILTLNLGGLYCFVCPCCLTLQVPRKLYNGLKNEANSNIIKPT